MADLSIQDVRKQYPQYGDMSDDALAGALHDKYYKDMPLPEFRQKIGLPTGAEKAIADFKSNEPIAEPAWQKILPAAGSILGGIGGGIVGGPGGALGGTALGASIGTSAEQVIRGLRGAPVGKMQSPDGTPYETSTGAVLHEQLGNVAEQSLMQMGGEVVGALGGAAVKAMSPAARVGALAAQKTLAKEGGGLSAAQAVESPTLDLVESFARAGAGGKGRFIALDKANADALQATKNNLIQSISKAPADDVVAGQAFKDAVSNGDKAHGEAAADLYKNFDATTQGALVDTKPLQVFSQGIVDQLKRTGNVGKTDSGGQLLDQMASVPNTMTFADAQELRSNLLARVRDLRARGDDGKAMRNATVAAQIVDKAMEESARNLPPEVFKQFREINAFYKEGKDAFNNDIITNLMLKNPERVGETLFRNGNVTEILQAQKTLQLAQRLDKGGKINADEVTNGLRAGYLNGMLTAKPATNIEGETTAKSLMKDLASAKTDRQFAVMFTPQQLDAISEFGRTAYLTLNNKPSNFGILAPLLQASAIGDLALNASGSGTGTKSPALDVGIIAAPAILAKVLTNPKAVGVLIRGIELGPKAQGSPAVMAKLVGALNEAMKEDK